MFCTLNRERRAVYGTVHARLSVALFLATRELAWMGVIVGTHCCLTVETVIVGIHCCNSGNSCRFWLTEVTSVHVIAITTFLCYSFEVTVSPQFLRATVTNETTYWREEYLWNVCVLHRIDLSKLVFLSVHIRVGLHPIRPCTNSAVKTASLNYYESVTKHIDIDTSITVLSCP